MWQNLRKALQKEAAQNLEIIKQNSKLWKGKKIVSEEEWRKISSGTSFLFLKYIPDTFLTTSLLRYIDYSKISEEKIQEWARDYYEFLEHTKNPEYGKTKCKNCILNQESSTKSGMRNITLKFLSEKYSVKSSAFPCTVMNLFECPYVKEPYSSLIHTTGQFWTVIYQALEYAADTTYQADRLRDVDFELGGPAAWPYTVEANLKELRMPQIMLREVDDTCKILTDKKLLEILLEQYIRSLESGDFVKICSYHEDKVNSEFVRRTKDFIIDFFTDYIKEYIKPETLFEKGGRVFLNNWYKSMPRKLTRLEKCAMCDNSANIHCVNCDVWACINHWRQHGIKVHGYNIIPKSPTA